MENGKKQDIIVETDGHPETICISVWGDKIIQSQLQIGIELQIDCDLESKEFNNRWYTDVKAWRN